MGLRIRTNVSSMEASRRLASTGHDRSRTLARLSSGERIVRSGDDAAGLSISEKLKASVRSLQAAERNTQDGISLVQTAEGGVVEAQNILTRLRELSVQAASDTVGPAERSFLDREFQHLKAEITRVANTTAYDGTQLLNGSSDTLELQVGIDNDAVQDRIVVAAGAADMTAHALGLEGTRIDTKESAVTNLPKIDSATNRLSGFRSYLGGVQSNLLEHSRDLDVHRTNLAHGNSRIRDADYAEWAAENTRQSVLEQANVAVLAQANTVARNAVRLLENA